MNCGVAVLGRFMRSVGFRVSQRLVLQGVLLAESVASFAVHVVVAVLVLQFLVHFVWLVQDESLVQRRFGGSVQFGCEVWWWSGLGW